MAQPEQNTHIAGPVLVILLLGGFTIYSFGYLRAVMHRANRDYKATKAQVPILRRGFWHFWWRAVKVGTLVALGLIILVAWTVHDARDEAPAAPAPSTSRTAK